MGGRHESMRFPIPIETFSGFASWPHAAASWAYHNHDALGSLRQLTDADGTVTLSKSYLPYGDLLNSSGVGASSYGFTGEMHDMATGLVYLRARYYAPGDGRFLTQDPWTGDINRPMSYNGWLYVYANPANLIDPGGQKPVCPPGEEEKCDDWLPYPPDIVNFNEKNHPAGLTFTPTSNYPFYVDIYEGYVKWDGKIEDKGRLVGDVNFAQSKIKPGWDELCGPVSTAAIIRLTHPNITANKVVAKAEEIGAGPNGTYLSDLYKLGLSYGSSWRVAYGLTTAPGWVPENKENGNDYDPSYKRALAGQVRRWLSTGRIFLIAGTRANGSTGRLYDNIGRVGHWVVITGFSKQWEINPWDSPQNWVRIYNPFDNDIEYYPWRYFSESWYRDGFQMVKFENKSQPPPPWFPGKCRLEY